MSTRICIVPVCYNAYEDALRLLGSLEQAYVSSTDIHLDVALSDNSTVARPKCFDAVKYSFNYFYLKNDNIGYFPAFNKALKVLPLFVNDYDFVVVCNVDLVVSNDFFSVLQHCSSSERIGLIAPGIFSDKDGRDLNPKMMRRPSLAKINFMRAVCSNVVLFNLYHKLVRLRERSRSRSQQNLKKYERRAQVTPLQKMYGAHGSFMIFTRRYFAQGAHVDYPRFLFGEEGFVAEQLRMHDLEIAHVPELRIFDKEHASTSQARSDFICAEHKKSYDYFYANFLKKRH